MPWEAKFTSEQDMPCVCSRCQQKYPPGTKLHYMQDAKHNDRAGRYLCASCHDYYKSKPSSRRISTSSCDRYREDHRKQVHSEVAAAQRGGESWHTLSIVDDTFSDAYPLSPQDCSASIVQAIGPGQGYDQWMPPPTSVPQSHAMPGSHGFVLSQPWPSRHYSLAHPTQYPQSGPLIALPGQFGQGEPIPNFFTTKPQTPGYQDAHQMYNQMRSFFASMAYKTQNHELVVVKSSFVVLRTGRTNPVLIEVCFPIAFV